MSKYNYDNVAPPRVTCSIGFTVNAGNFESLRLDFGLEDVKRPDESIKQAIERVFNVVNAELDEKVKEARRSLG